MSDGVDKVIQRIAEVIVLGKQDGSIQADTDALTVAQVTYQMWMGAALLSALQKIKHHYIKPLKATAFLLKSGQS